VGALSGELRDFLDAHRVGVLATAAAGGRPLQSVVEILTQGIGPATAAIMQRIAGMSEPPEPQSDEALAAIDRVILAITVERVSAVNYIEPGAAGD